MQLPLSGPTVPLQGGKWWTNVGIGSPSGTAAFYDYPDWLPPRCHLHVCFNRLHGQADKPSTKLRVTAFQYLKERRPQARIQAQGVSGQERSMLH